MSNKLPPPSLKPGVQIPFRQGKPVSQAPQESIEPLSMPDLLEGVGQALSDIAYCSAITARRYATTEEIPHIEAMLAVYEPVEEGD